MRRTAIILIGSLVLAGCPNPLEWLGDEGVTAELDGGNVVIRNGTETVVYYAAIGDNALILFAPCVRPDCPRLSPGETVRQPLSEVPAGTESEIIRVHWWSSRVTEEGRVPGEVRTVVLRR